MGAMRVLVAVLACAVVSGCGEGETHGISVPLSGSGSGTVYVLQAARFRVTGPQTLTLQGDDAPGTTLSVPLPVGDYQVRLLDGWSLVRLPDGTTMDAVLASPNPVSVTVVDGASTRVTFVFDVLGEIVAMTGDGDLDIGFVVNEPATDAGSTADAGRCADGLMRPCGSGVGICRGDELCMAGDWIGCTAEAPRPESCDGADEDCDGVVDEDCAPPGCVVAADCGMPVFGAWSPCGGFSSSCDETGQRTRTVESFRCDGGACVSETSMETESCSRSTDGVTCGSPTVGAWSACDFSSTCDETGTRTRTVSTPICASGACDAMASTESGACSRDTDGTPCGGANVCMGGTCVTP